MKRMQRILSLLLALVMLCGLLPWELIPRAAAAEPAAEAAQHFVQPETEPAPPEEPQQDRDVNRYFTKQPTGGNIAPDGYYKVTWKTNFSPRKIEIVAFGGNALLLGNVVKERSGNTTSFSMDYNTVASYGIGAEYYVRAYYGTDTLDYITSDSFDFTMTPRTFTTQPQGGGILPEGSRTITWKTNFTPKKIEFFVFGNYNGLLGEVLETLSGSATSCSIDYDTAASYGNGADYYIRAYYGTDTLDYITSDSFDFELTPRGFTIQPQGGTIAPGGFRMLSWKANFYPMKYEVVVFGQHASPLGDVVKAVTGGTTGWSIDYDTAARYGSDAVYKVRAYYGTGPFDYCSSESFDFELTPRSFTTQPQGGSILPESARTITWQTNFTPQKIEFVVYGGYASVFGDVLETRPGSATSCSIDYDTAASYGSNAYYYVRAYYGTGLFDYCDSDAIAFELTPRSFTTQPQGGSIVPEGSRTISWQTNFTPQKIEFIARRYYSATSEYILETRPGSATSCSIDYDTAAGYGSDVYYFVRAYYGTGPFDSCDSESFAFELTPRSFTTQPQGGTVSPQNSVALSWTTNFTPVKHELVVKNGSYDYTVVQLLPANTNAYALDYATASLYYGTTYYVRAYYGTGNDDYVPSAAIHIDVNPSIFGPQPPASISIPEGGYGTLSWGTSQTPTSLKLMAIPAGSSTAVELKTLSGSDTSCTVTFSELDAKGAENGKLFLRAVCNSRLCDSDYTNYSLSYKVTGAVGGLNWSFNKSTGELSISGTGAMADFSGLSSVPWKHWRTRITKLSVGNGVTKLGKNAFYGCTGLKALYLYDSVTEIHENAFAGCTALNYVRFFGSRKAWQSVTVASGNAALNNASKYFSCIDEGSCGDSLSWRLSNDNVLTISGTGAMRDWDSASGQPWAEWSAQIWKLVVQNGVTCIGKNAFRGCTALTEAELSAASTLQMIGEAAFRDCTNLSALSLPAGLTEIKDIAFRGCAKLTTLALPGALTKLGAQAFDSCTGLKTLVLNQSLQQIGNAAFRSCSGLTGALTIPASVTVIGDEAFRSCTRITGLSLPSGLSSLGQNAFRECSALTGVVTIPGSVDAVPNGLFQDCSAISGVNFGAGITEIGDKAFSGCTAMYKILDIPQGVTTIGYETFCGCSKFDTVKLPVSLNTVEVGAFDGCSKLKNVQYSGMQAQWSLISIGARNQPLLDAVNFIAVSVYNGELNASVSWHLSSDGTLQIFGSGAMPDWNSASDAPWAELAQYIRRIEVYGGVTTIGASAFRGLVNVTETEIDSRVGTIKENAFCDCAALADVYYNSFEGEWNAIEISATGNAPLLGAQKHFEEYYAWIGGTDLMWYLNSDGVLRICSADTGGDEFEIPDYGAGEQNPWVGYAPYITTVIFDDGITRIGAEALRGLTGVTTVYLPATLRSIGTGAFGGCESLSDVYYEGLRQGWDAVTDDDEDSNEYLYLAQLHLGSVTEAISGTELSWTIQDGVLYIYPRFAGAAETAIPDYYDQDEAPWEAFADSICRVVLEEGVSSIGIEALAHLDNAASIRIPDSVTVIDDDAFAFSGFEEVTLPDSVTQLGTGVFWYCDDLLQVNLSGSLAEIPNSSFCGCGSLVGAVRIPEGVAAIGEGAFRNCVQVEYIYFPSTLTNIADGAFSNCECLCEVYVNKYWFETGSINIGTNNTDLTAAEWIYNRPGGVLETGLSWTLWENGWLEISGTGPMPDFSSYSAQPWFAYRAYITGVTVGDGVTTVGKYAFYNLSNVHSVHLGESLTKLGDYAYMNCAALTSVTVPEGVTYIGSHCFESCGALQTVSLPSTLTDLDGASFAFCSSLTEIDLPEGLTKIGTNTFRGCTALTGIDIPYSVTTVWEYAFFGCTALGQVRFEENVTTIRTGAFGNCPNLSTVIYGGLGEWWTNEVNIINNDYTVGGNTYNNSKLINASKAFLGVPLSARRYPDETFRAWLAGGARSAAIDADGNGYLSDAERNAVGSLDLHDMGLTSVQGIEWFPNLYSLNCSDNELTGIDVSCNTELEFLYCQNNGISALNLCGLPHIDIVNCSNNLIEELVWDAPTMASICEFDCSHNALTELFLGESFDNLYDLDCSWNEIGLLQVDNLFQLDTLNCAHNELTELDLSALENIHTLDVSENRMESLDVSDQWDLEKLDCSDNGMTALILTNGHALDSLAVLNCRGNGLTELDLTGTPEQVEAVKEGVVEDLVTATSYTVNDDHYLCVDKGVKLQGVPPAVELWFIYKPNTVENQNPTGVYFYAFGDGAPNAAWPGAALTDDARVVVLCDAETDHPSFCYAYRVTVDSWLYSGVIFSDGSGNQTADLAFAENVIVSGGTSYQFYYANSFSDVSRGEDVWPAASLAAVAPTCTAEGSNSYYGLVTLQSHTLTVPALGHDLSAGPVHAPGCTEQGWTDYDCSRCDYVERRDETEATGHSWGDWAETAAPTCTAEGEQTRSCSVCGETQTAAVDAAGHSWGEPAYSFSAITNPSDPMSCTATATCTACGEAVTETVTGTYETTYAPNTEQTGLGTYSFSFENNLFVSQVFTVELPMIPAEYVTVYVIDRSDAMELACYVWGENGDSGWPGAALTPAGVDMDGNLYYEITVNVTGYGEGLILNDLEGRQYPLPDQGGLDIVTDADGRGWVVYAIDVDYTAHTEQDVWPAPGTVTCEPACEDEGEEEFTGLLTGAYVYGTIPALGHLPGEPVQENYVEPTATEDGGYDTVVYCQRCNAELSREHTVLPATGPVEPIETSALHIYSSISVGTDMIITFSVRKNDLTNYGKFWIEVVKHEPVNGDVTYVYEQDVLTENNATWTYQFNKIYAKEMGLDVDARLYVEDAAGQVYMSPARNANIRDHLGGRLTATNNIVEQRVLAADMLNYGAAAQLCMDYQTDHLVNEELTDEQLEKLHEYETKELPAADKTNSNTLPEGQPNILYNSMTLGNEVLLNLSVRLPEDTGNVQVLVKEHDGGAHVATLDTARSGSTFQTTFSGIGADKMRTEYDLVTLVDGVETGNIRTWSVEGRVVEIRNGSNQLMTNVANALLTYGDAAAAYFAAN